MHEGFQRPRVRVGRIVVDTRQLDKRENAEYHQHDAPQHDIRYEKSGEIDRRAGLVSFAEDQGASHCGGDDVGHRVEGLGHRKPRRGAVLGAQYRDVRIRRGFDAGQAAGQHEKGIQERPEGLEPEPGGNEEKSARGDHHQSEQNPLLVADPADQQRRGKGEQEVGAKDRGLDESRLRFAHVQDILKMLVQHVQHGMAESPDEKEGGDHEEREQQSVVELFRVVRHL